jgi:hypothetical protein
MPVTVTRLYSTKEAADKAWNEMRRQRFSASDVALIPPPADGADPVPAIIEAGIGKPRAERFAERLRQGDTLLVVRPLFGSAEVAEQVLDDFGPVATSISDRDDGADMDDEDDATPFSRWLGWKVLSRNNPSPLSDAIGWSTLTKPHAKTYPATIPVKQLGGSAAPLSKLFGLPVLTRQSTALFAGHDVTRLSAKAAPFSSLLNLPVLTKHQR